MLRRSGIQWKYLKIGPYELCALAIIIFAVTVRIVLLGLGWPPLDSDEGTMGLMAMHIAFRGEHPIFFYGQGYMGAFEAYLAAIFFRLFGVSTFTLLLGLVILYMVFLIAMYLLTSLLYSKPLALVTLGLLAVGSNGMLSRELVAIGGYPETLMFGSLIMLLASWLALTSRADSGARNRWQRLLAYGVWGLIAGLGLWTHLLVAPFVLFGGLLLLFCWRELWSLAPLCLIAGLLIGAYPLIYYNMHAPPGMDSLTIFWGIHRGSGIAQPPFRQLFPQEVKGALLVSLPTMTGANPLCAASEVHFLNLSSVQGLRCTLVHTGWSSGIILLWVVAGLMAVKVLKGYYSPGRAWEPEERRSVALQCARLALLGSGALTLLLYLVSPDPALFPVPTSRYLVGLLIVTPAVLWPLWNGVGAVKPLALRFAQMSVAVRLAKISVILRRAVLSLIGVILLMGTFSIFTGIPPAPPVGQTTGIFALQVNDQHLDLAVTQALDRQQEALIRDLLRIGARHIYSDYWTCDRLIFQSQERIICGALKDDLGLGHDRYVPYQVIVHKDPQTAYVFPIGSPQAAAMARNVRSSNRHYRYFTFDGYVVYQPVAKR